MNCEACHGALAKHADDPHRPPPKLRYCRSLRRCHEANVASLKASLRWSPTDHANGFVCETCHVPHSPLIAPGAKS